MARQDQERVVEQASEVLQERPRSFAVAMRGIKTTGDVHALMEAVIQDVLGDQIVAQKANTVNRSTAIILRNAEDEMRFRQRGAPRHLSLGPAVDAGASVNGPDPNTLA